MIGHLKPQTCHLPAEAWQHYRQFYCGICANLRRDRGLAFSVLINNELSLILQSLSSFIAAELRTTPCPATAFLRKKNVFQHPSVELAAELSVILGSIKATDWASDEPDFLKNTIARSLEKVSQPIRLSLSPDLLRILEEYVWLTRTNSPDFEKVRTYSGHLARQLFLEIASKTTFDPQKGEKLPLLFEKIGELISTADHLIDLKDDLKKRQYNPILYAALQKGTSIAQETNLLRREFDHYYTEILALITDLHRAEIIDPNSHVLLKASVRNINKKIQTAHDQVIRTPSKTISVPFLPKLTFVENACWVDFGACCCECACDACCNNPSSWDCCCDFCEKCGDKCCDCCDGDCCNNSKKTQIPPPDLPSDDPLKGSGIEMPPQDSIPEPPTEIPQDSIPEPPEIPKDSIPETPQGSQASPRTPPNWIE